MVSSDLVPCGAIAKQPLTSSIEQELIDGGVVAPVAKLLLYPRVTAADADGLGAAIAVNIDVAIAAIVKHVDLLDARTPLEEADDICPECIDQIEQQRKHHNQCQPVWPIASLLDPTVDWQLWCCL